MRLFLTRPNHQRGNTLLGVVFIGGLMCLAIAATLSLTGSTTRQAFQRVDWTEAFYHAENALIWAAQQSLDSPPAAGSSSYYSTANSTLSLAYMFAGTSPGFSNAWVKVVQPTTMANNMLVITASAKVNNTVRTIQAQVTVHPPSQVFDYEYFLNNWGWWWGLTITGNGSQRSNWDFDFQGGPVVNGFVYSAGQVEENEVPVKNNQQNQPFNGYAGEDPMYFAHSGVPRVQMPNLLDFSVYDATALSSPTNSLWWGTNKIVSGVLPGTGGLYIDGTSTPITINGTVVVNGDVVIKGKVSGHGTLYVGGDLYVANDLTYLNPPNFSAAPEVVFNEAPFGSGAGSVACANWVAASATNDLVAYAVRGSIFGGDVTDPDWVNYCYNYPGSGLASVGDESQLGADGILGTPDDGIPFLHPDGTWSAWYDADGDGVCERNYNYYNDIYMTPARASRILNYPTNADGTPVAYNQVASDNMGNLDGIFYTDHAVAMRMTDGLVTWNGTIVSRNEQIVFQSWLTFTYDSRVNSRYQNNPNNVINLGLPFGKPIEFNSFVELTPDATNL